MVVIRAGAELIALALSALLAIWLSRTVGPTGLGYYAVTLAIVRFGGGLTGGGLPTVGSQRVAQSPEMAQKVWTDITSLRLPLAGLAVLLALLIAWALPIGDHNIKLLVQLAAPTWLSLAISSEWLLVGTGQVGAIAAARVLAAITSVGAAILLVHDADDLPQLAIVILAPSVVGAAVTTVAAVVKVIGRPRIAPRGLDTLKDYGGDALHYFKADLSVLIYSSVDRLFLYVFTTPAIVGFYEAAYKLIQPFYAISVVVNDAMFVRMAQALADRNGLHRTLRVFTDLMFFATIPVGFFLVLYSDGIVGALYGPPFSASALYLALLGWTITIGFLAGAITIPFMAWRQPRPYADAMIAGNLVNVVGNLALIPLFLGAGAAIATGAAKAAVAIVGWRHFRDLTRYSIALDFAAYLLFSALAFSVTLAVEHVLGMPTLASMAVFIGTYTGLVGLIRWLPYVLTSKYRLRTW